MNELYFPEAIVLDREDSNDVDSRFSIYAKGHGKFFAKAKSAKKILSKLSGHLEPGSVVQVRLVGNGALQVVDALKRSKVEVQPTDLYLLNQLLPEEDFDFALWQELMDVQADRGLNDRLEGGQSFDWKKVLKILGWDPEHTTCQYCEARPDYFVIRDQSFVCGSCITRLNRGSLKEMIMI